MVASIPFVAWVIGAAGLLFGALVVLLRTRTLVREAREVADEAKTALARLAGARAEVRGELSEAQERLESLRRVKGAKRR
ncbi:MAG TPA: hypothetical protein VGB83_04290 [Actinomycetota bacterium]